MECDFIESRGDGPSVEHEPPGEATLHMQLSCRRPVPTTMAADRMVGLLARRRARRPGYDEPVFPATLARSFRLTMALTPVRSRSRQFAHASRVRAVPWQTALSILWNNSSRMANTWVLFTPTLIGLQRVGPHSCRTSISIQPVEINDLRDSLGFPGTCLWPPEEFKQTYGSRTEPRFSVFGFSRVPLLVPLRVKNPIGASTLPRRKAHLRRAGKPGHEPGRWCAGFQGQGRRCSANASTAWSMRCRVGCTSAARSGR